MESRTSLTWVSVGLAVTTGVIHLIVLNVLFWQRAGTVDAPFIVNGVGFLVLAAALLGYIPFLRAHGRWVRIGLMCWSALTLVAWFILGELTDLLGIFTAVIEAALLITSALDFLRSDP